MPGSLTVGPGGQIQGSPQVSRTSEIAVISKGQEQLRSLSAGDSLSGKVVSVMKGLDGSRTAQIDLGNNTLVDAKLQNGMQLSTGQVVSFSVKSSASGTLTLTPLYQNTAALDATASKALIAAGLSVTDELGQMVSEMMKEGMSIDKQSLLQMSRVLTDNPGADTSTLVQMKNLNIPITEGNIQQFQNYQNYQHQVLNGANAIIDELPNAFSAMAQAGDKTGALDLYGSLMKLFAGGDQAQGTGISDSIKAGANEASINSLINAEGGEDSAGKAAEGKGSAGDAANEDPLKTIKGDGTLTNKAQASADGMILGKDGLMPASDDGKEVSGQLIAGSNTQAAAGAGNALGIGAKMDLAQFVSALKSAGVSEDALNELIKAGSGDQAALLRQLSELYDKTIHNSAGADRAWGRLFSSDTFNELLKNNIASSWTIRPDDVSDKDNVRNLYERLNSQVKQLTTLLQGHVGENSSVFQSSQNLSQNIDFMNQLNQMYAYVQLPLKMSGNDAHGDLYVYSNKKHMASDDGSVSALLHLDMNNLGPLDVYVRMTDMKVSTNFYMADESCIDLIMEHIDELTARLNKRGYQMSYQVLPSEDLKSENRAVDALLQADDKMTTISSTSFDARA
ncbi:flagellar hook-length control protein FliK [Butyrivibrio sp. TB]|uniref:flagellar hook-length control protein FliK n=1 Tax=Butyrivibrio sp. TB TaxID=1520809 RepID=UPI0008CC7AFD|nr:flagellar hook-length control protein FliK [Butyrivibrio sp. TB]SEP55071.1 hook-length control protein FliK [Butyrivibrio sp. TB]